MFSKASEALRGVVDLLYPPLCPLCFAPLDREDEVICFRCIAAMTPATAWRCDQCGAGGFGAQPEPGRKCKLCPPADAAWQGAFAVAPYRGEATRCVHRFKYGRRLEVGETMARMMCRGLQSPLDELGARLDLIAPVPLHWRRRLQRGFNQSALLAERLAAVRNLRNEPSLLRRVRHTQRQALLPAERRAQNVAGAFGIRKKSGNAPHAGVRDLGVLLVDDVMTTGHTIQECARVLKDAGAREVWVACFARAGMGMPDDNEWV